jgi:PKD repeat protein
MPEARITFIFRDDQNGTTRKSFEGDFADQATLDAAVTALVGAVQNVVAAGLVRYEVSTITDVASVPVAGKSVFERATISTRLDTGDGYALEIPAPVEAMFSGNSVDITYAPLVTFTDLLDGAAANWTVSDGDGIDTLVSGARTYASSGETNLPS